MLIPLHYPPERLAGGETSSPSSFAKAAMARLELKQREDEEILMLILRTILNRT